MSIWDFASGKPCCCLTLTMSFITIRQNGIAMEGSRITSRSEVFSIFVSLGVAISMVIARCLITTKVRKIVQLLVLFHG